jgi:hypothetical protein
MTRELRDPIRIATVRATGLRYIVQRIDFRDQVAFCRGEVVACQGVRTQHGPDVQLKLADVAVTSTMKTEELADALFEQGARAAVAALRPGCVLVVSAGRGDSEQVARTAREAAEASGCSSETRQGRTVTRVSVRKPRT